MVLPTDPSLREKYQRQSYLFNCLLILVPILVLVGWQFDLAVLRKMGSPVTNMNPMTAVCLLCLSSSLLLLRKDPLSPSRYRAGMLLAAFVLLVALIRLVGLVSPYDIAVDTWLFPEKFAREISSSISGRFTIHNVSALGLMSLSLMTMRKEFRNGVRPAQIMMLLVGLISLLSALSYLFKTTNYFGLMPYIPLALNTALSYLIFSLVFFYAWPDKGFMRHISSPLGGSLSARVLLPAAILLPAIFGLIHVWGYWRGIYDSEFGVTLFTLVTIIALVAVSWYTAVSLNRRELEQIGIRAQLAGRQEEINAIFQNAPDAIVVLDRQGNIVKWNPESARLFGWKEEEVVGKELAMVIIPAELREAHRASLARFSPDNNSGIIGKTIELWGVKRDGSPVDVAIRISPFEIEGKTYFVGFLRDITEKKQLEKRLTEFNEELTVQVNEKTEELTDILDRITDGFIAVDKDFVYTYANKKVGEITGKDPQDMIGKKVWELFPEAVGSETYQAFVKAMETQAYVTNTDYYEPLDLWQENHIYPSRRGLSIFIRDITEKMRAAKEIDKARSISDTLIDSLPGVFYFYDETGKFIRWNKQFEKVTGYAAEEIVRMHPTQFFAEDQREYIAGRIQGVFEKGVNDAEADLVHKDGTRTPHFFKATTVIYDGQRCLLGTGFDMTEKRRAEEDLKLSEQKYRLLFFANPLAMWMLSLPEFKIIEANESALRQYGYSREEFLSMDVLKLRPEEEWKTYKEKLNKNFRGIHYAGVWKHIRKDGNIIYVNIITHDTWYKGRPVRLVLGNEVTEQYLAEERLKESYSSIKRLTDHLNTVREQERLHIAREIHDELGQLLTVLKMDVSWLNKKLQPEEGPIRDKITDLSALLDTTVKTVRRISSELRPSLIDDLGLVAAMEWHIDEFRKRSGIEVINDLPETEIQLSDSVKIGLYRILQESLTNVARHSHAKKVEVMLLRTQNQLILSIKDDGIGFDESKRKKKTLGLIGAKERAEAIGGTYSITGEPGKGTCVEVVIPFSSSSDNHPNQEVHA